MCCIKKVKNSGLHDYQLKNIDINYSDSKIEITVKKTKNKIETIKIEDFFSFSMTNEREWGKGDYIVSSDIKEYKEQGRKTMELWLNSGVIIRIVYQE